MTTEKKFKWKDTLNLPKTQFPMKAQLNRKEPEILKNWKEDNLYEKILQKRQGSPLYVFHDGPPYANGNIHIGHALNKILKDFIIKGKSMEGHLVRYIPGWDCHGLPIEIKVDQNLGAKKKDMSIIEVREECRKYAERYVDIQRDEFVRLGIFGDWENPYTTLEHEYEANIIKYFKSFVENGNVLRKKRPVYWCPSCKTALAEAEVEYANHTSPSIYVKFLLKDKPGFLQKYSGKDIFVLIWTTTPWTIPANLAIAVNPQYDYSLFEMNGEQYIAASRLIPVLADILKTEYKILEEFKGEQLEKLNAAHPLYDRNSILVTQDYVVLDQGTGCVHTAPGHGEEDYRAGLEYGLDIYSPVGPNGCFDSTTGKYEGKFIFKANNEIVEDLRNAGRLLYTKNFDHSYPHCWRCKKPVIFRATEQWFIAMDVADLRQKALQEIEKVKWLPAWGQERISNMVKNRPDWCISRQRDWGVPIPVFFCKECDEPYLSVEAVEKTEAQFRNHGSNSWYSQDISEFLPAGSKCANCGCESFERGKDIIDVWFESGSSFGVLDFRPDNRFPSEIYLEGGDQYRGWFHSSLLVAVSNKKRAPYNTVITHGWALDSNGRAMSKSLGNVVRPQDIIKDRGAEILRLWVAMVNYREDIRISDEVLARTSESYRKIRNTWRFMLGVLEDFDPEQDNAADENLREVDLFILHKLQEIKQKVLQSYKDFEYHVIYHTISNFFTIELSSFYLNFIKDNLYCNTKASPTRKAAQTAIFKILKDTLLIMAPILTFTAEEAWEHLPSFPGKEKSVHLQLFPEIEKKYLEPGKIDKEKWEKILALRDRILKEIEEARSLKVIGDSLEAELNLQLDDNFYDVVSGNIELFKEITVVAKINATKSTEEKITVKKSEGNKCLRCWNWYEEDTSGNQFPEICPRCAQVVEEMNLDPEK
jgi:isoleucyl-tRNA synthetase